MFVSGIHALHPNAISVKRLSQEREELQKHVECLTQINENMLHIYSTGQSVLLGINRRKNIQLQ